MNNFQKDLEKFDTEFKNRIVSGIENNDSTEYFCERNINFILDKFFESAKHSINIFVNSLNDIHFNDVDYLFKGHYNLPKEAIKIIDLNQSREQIEYFSNLFTIPNNVIVYKSIKYKDDSKKLMKFIIIDGKRYIMQYPGDNTTFRVCCFNPNKCKERNEFFNTIWNIEG